MLLNTAVTRMLLGGTEGKVGMVTVNQCIELRTMYSPPPPTTHAMNPL